MALPPDGPMSASKINTEFGRGGTAEFQFSRAEGGAYGALNTASAAKPNGERPHSLSEWYRYDHGAVSCPPSGTYLSSYCSGCTLYYTYANGSCGTYDVSQGVTTTCGPCCGAPAAGQLLSSNCEECTEVLEYTDGCYGSYFVEQQNSETCCPSKPTILTGPYPNAEMGCYDGNGEVITVYLYDQADKKGIYCYEYNPNNYTESYEDSKFTSKLYLNEWYHSSDCNRAYFFIDGAITEYFDC